MSAILRRAVLSAQAYDELDIDIGVYDLLEKTLSRRTKDMIDKSGINLHVLAAIIDQTLAECKSEDEIDLIFNEKFHNQGLVVGLMEKYRDEPY